MQTLKKTKITQKKIYYNVKILVIIRDCSNLLRFSEIWVSFTLNWYTEPKQKKSFLNET